jgi:hypothetical protein
MLPHTRGAIRKGNMPITLLLLVAVALAALSASQSTIQHLPPTGHVYADTGLFAARVPLNGTFACKPSLKFIAQQERGQPLQLASYPGSGNTWMRELIQRGTGLVTGSAYRDASLKDQGFPGETVRNGSVIAVRLFVCLFVCCLFFSVCLFAMSVYFPPTIERSV